MTHNDGFNCRNYLLFPVLTVDYGPDIVFCTKSSPFFGILNKILHFKKNEIWNAMFLPSVITRIILQMVTDSRVTWNMDAEL